MRQSNPSWSLFLLIGLLFPAITALAQLSNDSKSSASASASAIDPGHAKPQSAAPVSMTECEGINNCASWTFLGGQGNGQWPSGNIANLTVDQVDSSRIVIRRADSTGASAGMTVTYTGTRHGENIGGSFTSSWPGHWENKFGYWYAIIESTHQGLPSVMRICLTTLVPCDARSNTLKWSEGHYDEYRAGATAVSATYSVVHFTPDSFVMNVKGVTQDVAGLTGVYTGRVLHDNANVVLGKVTFSRPGSPNTTTDFQLNWGAAIVQDSQAQIQQPVVLRPILCFSWFFGIVCD